MYGLECVSQLAQVVWPNTARSGRTGVKKLPAANGRGVGESAGQLDVGAGESSVEVVPAPIYHRAGSAEPPGCSRATIDGERVRSRGGAKPAALAQHQAIDL